MKLTIFGQTPSKKSSQQITTPRIARKKIEACAETLFHLRTNNMNQYIAAVEEIIKAVKARPMLLPNKKYMEWERGAIYQLQTQKAAQNAPTITEPVNVASIIYRLTKRRIDLTNLHQSIHDVLERAGILENDFLVETTNGSRRILGVEKGKERVDIYITKADPF